MLAIVYACSYEAPDGKSLTPCKRWKAAGLRDTSAQPSGATKPTDFSVLAGIRAGNGGRDFEVPANGVASVFVPDGRYDIFFVYSDKPDALFQGDDFTLAGNGVEIQIIKVTGGNYSIRRVK